MICVSFASLAEGLDETFDENTTGITVDDNWDDDGWDDDDDDWDDDDYDGDGWEDEREIPEGAVACGAHYYYRVLDDGTLAPEEIYINQETNTKRQ